MPSGRTTTKQKEIKYQRRRKFLNITYKHMDKPAIASHVWTENHKIQKGRKFLKELKFLEE